MAKFAAAQTSDKCHVDVLGMKMLPAAFTSGMLSLSVLLQTFVFLGTSAIADFGGLRKLMLLLTAFIGGIFTCAFVVLGQSKLYFAAGVLLLITNIFYGYSVVFYNAFLPPIIRSMPEYLEASRDEKHDTMDRLTNKISTRGFMLGYAAGVFLLLVSIPIVLFAPKIKDREWYQCERGQAPVLKHDDDTSLAFRISIFLCGLWWIGLSIFALFWINTRPGPPLPAGKNYITASIGNVWNTVRQIKHLRHSFIFLVAYFLFSDAYTTISYAGILFAKNDMGAGSSALIILLIEVPLTALIGNFFFLWVKNKWNFESKTMININLAFFSLLPIYSFLGFIPSSPIGMKQLWELFVFGAIFGLNLGSIQSFARTVFISLTPPGHESEFFGFYELTDKGSAWIGPAIVAVLTEWTGQVRYSFIYLFIALAVPMWILTKVDVKLGTEQAKAFSEAENAEPMVEFGRLDSTDDDDDGLGGLSDERGLTPRGHSEFPAELKQAAGMSGRGLLDSSLSNIEDEDEETAVALEL